MCIIHNTTPTTVVDKVIEEDEERLDYLAGLLAAEIQHVVVFHLTMLKQKITANPALLHALSLVGSPDRILIQTENCKPGKNACLCLGRPKKDTVKRRKLESKNYNFS